MMDRRLILVLAALVLAATGLLMWDGMPGWGLLVACLCYLGVALYGRYRGNTPGLARLKAERAADTFETFRERLNRPDYDRKLVLTIYTAVRLMAEGVGLRLHDDPVQDLKIAPDDLGEAPFAGLKGPLALVDSAEAVNANPHRHRRQMVGGLIDVFAAHPKLPDQTASLTPSARRT